LAAGIVIEEKNWPPFLPLIHHDITNEIPSHLQRMQYVAFASFLGMLLLIHNILKTFTLMNNIQYSPLFNGAICNGHAFPPNILDDVLLSSTFWIFHWSYLLTGGL